MAEIYDYATGQEMSMGLQGCDICDEAIQTAVRLAKSDSRTVELHDDDGVWRITPSGAVTFIRDLDRAEAQSTTEE